MIVLAQIYEMAAIAPWLLSPRYCGLSCPVPVTAMSMLSIQFPEQTSDLTYRNFKYNTAINYARNRQLKESQSNHRSHNWSTAVSNFCEHLY